MKTKLKRLPAIPLLAGVLILLHYILINAVAPPVNSSWGIRYSGYWLLVIASSIGTNLLALYLGYTACLTKKPWQRLGKIAFYLVMTSLIGVIWGLIFYKAFDVQDLWIGLFPISYNNFPFATSILIWYVGGPFIARYIANFSQEIQQAMAFILSWLVLLMPFIFAKPLWGMTDGNSFIWVGTLFVFGILIAQGSFSWLNYYKKTFFVAIIGFILVVTTAKLMPITQSPSSLFGRFYSSQLLNVGLISLAVFGLLNKFFTTHFTWLTRSIWPNWFALCAYFVSCLLIITNRLANDLHINDGMSTVEWLALIVMYTAIMLVAVGLLTLVLNWFTRIKSVHYLIVKFTLNNFTDLIGAPKFAKRMLRENWHILVVVMCGFIFTVTQMSVTFLTTTGFSWKLLYDILTVTRNRLILNVIIFVCCFLLLFSLINRFWPALVFTSGISIFIGVAEYLKISLRDEPILPVDLSMVTAFGEIAKMLSPIIIVAAVVLLIILITASLILQHHLGGIYPHDMWKRRLITFLAMLLFFSGSFFVNHENSLPYIIFRSFNIDPLFYDQSTGARMNGPIVQFINNLDVKIMDEPAGYSKAKIKSIMTKYNRQAKQINQTRHNELQNQTIVFVLSESFSDPNRVPKMKVTPNPIPYLTKLKQTTDSGLMLSSGYGGGTANMEWQSLTGLSISNLSPTLPTPYTQLVSKQKIVPAFTNLFDSKIAIHPYNASLYNRKQVFKAFGFQQFYYQGSNDQLSYEQKLADSSYISDDSAYKQTMKVIKRTQSGSRFIQLSTMQNHMPYTTNYKGKKFRIMGSAFDETNRDSVETYVQGLSYTDKALKQFIAEIDKVDKPVTVVWYGDHLAGLYKSSLMDKYPIQLHQTDYFIYNNQTHQLSYTDRLVSPYAFPALALANGNVKVTPYYALLTQVTDKLPAMTTDPAASETNNTNGANIFVNQKGRQLKYRNLSSQQKKIFRDYQLIQYDLTAGQQYAARWAQQKLK